MSSRGQTRWDCEKRSGETAAVGDVFGKPQVLLVPSLSGEHGQGVKLHFTDWNFAAIGVIIGAEGDSVSGRR